MTRPLTVYPPADYDHPALLKDAERLGCDPKDVGFIDNSDVGPVAVRLYRSSDGSLFMEAGKTWTVGCKAAAVLVEGMVLEEPTGFHHGRPILYPARFPKSITQKGTT